MKSLRVPKILLYEDPSSKTLDLQRIAAYFRSKLGVDPEIKPQIFSGVTDRISIAKALAEARVHDLFKPPQPREPSLGEIQVELGFLSRPEKRVYGVLYEGLSVQRICSSVILPEELSLGYLHAVFVNRLLGTREADGRYHIHAAIFGFPALISVPGIVEGPAKPREYYRLRQFLGEEEAKAKFAGRFLEYDDPRLTEVVKGYLMQALFHHIFGDPFCDDRRCRLYNARWQEEVLEAQLSEPELCERHEEMLRLLAHAGAQTVF